MPRARRHPSPGLHPAAAKQEERLRLGYDLRTVRETVLRKLIIKALTKCAFNATHAAKLLGISRQCLLRYVKRYKIAY